MSECDSKETKSDPPSLNKIDMESKNKGMADLN